MAKKEFTYKGNSVEDVKQMSSSEFADIATSRMRRSIKRGMRESHKILLNNIKKSNGKEVKTHCRDMPILPEMIGSKISVYTGKDFRSVDIIPEMVGHFLGEFALTRNRVAHSNPGVGATKSSSATSR